MTKLLGVLLIRLDGTEYPTRKGSTFDPGGVKRTSRAGARKINGFSEEQVPSKAELTVDVDSAYSADQLRNWTGVLTVQCDTGQLYTVPAAWVTDPPPFDENEGTAKVTIEGEAAEELLS